MPHLPRPSTPTIPPPPSPSTLLLFCLAHYLVLACAALDDANRQTEASSSPGDAVFTLLPPLTENHCRLARSQPGLLSSAGRFARKLEHCDGGALRILVFGGSVTYGSHVFEERLKADSPSYPLVHRSNCWHDRSHVALGGSCKELTYGAVLERRLNEVLPCADGARHVVYNEAVKGYGSPTHLQTLRECATLAHLSGQTDERDAEVLARCQRLDEADIIFLDTGVNDKFDTAKNAELLARRLHREPRQRPAVYWLAPTMYYPDWGNRHKKPPFYHDVIARDQAVMLDYYGLPQISFQKAIAPDIARDAGQQLWRPFWSHDGHHPSAWGHAIVADLLLCNLHRDAQDYLRTPAGAFVSEATAIQQELPAPWLVRLHDEDLSFVTIGLSHPLDLADAVIGGRGFAREEDAAGKPGLIAHEVGAAVMLRMRPNGRARSGCELILTYLVSYEHMGVLEADVFLGPKVERRDGDAGPRALECNVEDMGELGEAAFTTLVDTLLSMEDKVSIPRETRLDYVIPPGHDCAWVRVRVVAAEPARSENKVKLLKLTTACPMPTAL